MVFQEGQKKGLKAKRVLKNLLKKYLFDWQVFATYGQAPINFSSRDWSLYLLMLWTQLLDFLPSQRASWKMHFNYHTNPGSIHPGEIWESTWPIDCWLLKVCMKRNLSKNVQKKESNFCLVLPWEYAIWHQCQLNGLGFFILFEYWEQKRH